MRNALLIIGLLLSIALVIGATYEVVTVVLPFDWSAAGAGAPPAPVSVELPR